MNKHYSVTEGNIRRAFWAFDAMNMALDSWLAFNEGKFLNVPMSNPPS